MHAKGLGDQMDDQKLATHVVHAKSRVITDGPFVCDVREEEIIVSTQHHHQCHESKLRFSQVQVSHPNLPNL
jgi:hypothetical protein